MNLELDELVAALKKDNSVENMNALWKHTFDLPRWLFIACGQAPNLNPFVGIVDETPMLMAFTDSEYLKSFAKNNNLMKEDESIEILQIDPKTFSDYAKSLIKGGVEAIVFNEGVHGYLAPLKNIDPMLKYFYQD